MCEKEWEFCIGWQTRAMIVRVCYKCQSISDVEFIGKFSKAEKDYNIPRLMKKAEEHLQCRNQ